MVRDGRQIPYLQASLNQTSCKDILQQVYSGIYHRSPLPVQIYNEGCFLASHQFHSLLLVCFKEHLKLLPNTLIL